MRALVPNQVTACCFNDITLRLSLLVDADAFLDPLDPTLFPGVPSSVEVHSGFSSSHARSAAPILAAVTSTLNAHTSTKPSVTLVGHSLGAALALLDSIYLPLHLPSSTQFKFIGYGLPRVGNQAFANLVDQRVTALNGGTGVTRITNKEDPIPINPGRFLGYVHPSGEVHIEDSNAWDTCPGKSDCVPKYQL